MKIVWDERKRQTTLETRAMDFADLTVDFFERSVVVAAKRGRYKQ
jgi:uncharacterized DUF497 family protein